MSSVNGTNIDELKSILQTVFPKIPTLNEVNKDKEKKEEEMMINNDS